MHYFYQFMNRDYDSFVEDFKSSFVRFMLHFAKNRTGKDVVVDKITPYPGTTEFVVGEIRRMFPAAKIIFLVRDGRDVLTSGTFDWLLKDAEGTDRHRFFVQRESGMTLRRFFDDQVLRRWAKNWAETVDELGATGAADCQVSFEDMKLDLEGVCGRVFDTLAVENNANVRKACVEATTFKATTGREAGQQDPTAKARKGVAGDWKNYFTRSDGLLFWQLAGSQLKLAGYEDSDDWVASLPEQLSIRSGD